MSRGGGGVLLTASHEYTLTERKDRAPPTVMSSRSHDRGVSKEGGGVLHDDNDDVTR